MPLTNAGKGRPKGALNKATRDIKDAAAKLLTDPAYLAALKVRLIRGTAGAMEVTMHHYAYGKPTDRHEVAGAVSGPIVFRWMEPGERDDDESPA